MASPTLMRWKNAGLTCPLAHEVLSPAAVPVWLVGCTSSRLVGMALRLMFGAPCGGLAPGDRCMCGTRPLLSSLSSDHLLTCGEPRSATNSRHDEVLRCLQVSCRELCMGVRWKPQFFNSESMKSLIWRSLPPASKR
jgi:hypothetical protein